MAYRWARSKLGCIALRRNCGKSFSNYGVIDRHALQRNPKLFCRLREGTAGAASPNGVFAALEGMSSLQRGVGGVDGHLGETRIGPVRRAGVSGYGRASAHGRRRAQTIAETYAERAFTMEGSRRC